MKRILKLTLFLICYSLLLNTASANSTHAAQTNLNNMSWICVTNASSSSIEADKKADESMTKNAKSAKQAFDYAVEHCRDCTKITCTQESK